MFDKEKFNWEFDEKCNTSKKKKDITIKYKNTYDEFKSSELEHVIKIYEKVGDAYVEKDLPQAGD